MPVFGQERWPTSAVTNIRGVDESAQYFFTTLHYPALPAQPSLHTTLPYFTVLDFLLPAQAFEMTLHDIDDTKNLSST